MHIFEYPNHLKSYFKDDFDTIEKLAKKIVDDNSDKYYLRTDGFITQLVEKGKETLYTKLETFYSSYQEYRGKQEQYSKKRCKE